MRYLQLAVFVLGFGLLAAENQESVVASDEELLVTEEELGIDDEQYLGFALDVDYLIEHPSIKPFYDALPVEEQEQVKLMIQELLDLVDETMLNLDTLFEKYRDVLDKFKAYNQVDIFNIDLSIVMRDQKRSADAEIFSKNVLST